MARYRDRDWLELMYHGREHTQAEMADRCGVSPRTIRTYMDEYGIPTRGVRGRNHGLYGRSRDEETRKHISETLEGREYDEEWRERLAEAKRGAEVSEDSRVSIGYRAVPRDAPFATGTKCVGSVERTVRTGYWTSTTSFRPVCSVTPIRPPWPTPTTNGTSSCSVGRVTRVPNSDSWRSNRG
jgi:transcriptional regulator with XRE-family HTH domain